jgi:hypothetical protein
MVHDHIKYASEYFNLSQGIRTALEYLATADLAALEPGRHDVQGDEVFALVSDYQTRTPAGIRSSARIAWNIKATISIVAFSVTVVAFLFSSALRSRISPATCWTPPAGNTPAPVT